MTASATVTSLTINDGTTVLVPVDGVVLFVGPNNAGKSQALRDIANHFASANDKGLVILNAEVVSTGTADDLRSRFEADRSIRRDPALGDRISLGDKGMHTVDSVLSWWDGGARQPVLGYFIKLADTETRLHASRPAQALNLFEKHPTHALHSMYLQPEMEDQLSTVAREAFGTGLILDVWAGGSEWALRVGDLPSPSSPRPEQAYLDALKELPLLHTQGDGVRSMIGLLLEHITGHQNITLIDEPEAFLHPPQARFLAKVLSNDTVESRRTVILSTHSSDVVHGILEGSAPATVVRLQRHGNENSAAVLDNDAVKRLWSDPLLRYSNLLEGLFTDAVVICESDADCKFFASIRDTLAAQQPGARRQDVLFTSCGGKHRMHVGVEALRAADVPVAVIGDFDVLNNWETLSRLIEKAGGDAVSYRSDWNVLDAALRAESRAPSVVGIKEAVNAAFAKIEEVSTKSLAPVREALKIESGWSRVKNSGLGGVPKGDAYRAAVQLLSRLAQIRIHLIPIGEMEDFIPEIGGHGPGWLADVLEGRFHEGPQADTARTFFEQVLGDDRLRTPPESA